MVYRCIWFTRTRNARPLLAVCTRITVGATTGRPQQIKPYRSFSILNSDSLRAAYGGCSLDVHCGGCVRPYGSVGVDEFTSGVPRSYLRAPSLAALPQQSESTTGRAGRRVAMRPWAAITNHGRHAPNPKGRTDCSIAKSTCTGVCNDILPFATLSRLGAQCAPRQRKIIRFVGEHSDSLRAALRRLLTGRPLRWVCSPLRFSQCR